MEKTVNERIMYLRNISNLNQRDFAKKIGITQTSLCQIENGGGYSKKTLQKIINSFNLSKEWLVEGKGEIYSKKNDDMVGDGVMIPRDVLFTLKGILIGKLGVNTFSQEVEPFFPKFEAYTQYSMVS